MTNFSLEKRVVAITGASRGIGKAIAIECAKAGANISLGSRDRDACELVARKCLKYGVKAESIKLDVEILPSISSFIDQTVHYFGKIDVLVNNVGLTVVKPASDITEEEFDKVTNINFKAPYFASVKAHSYMVKQANKGIIINISSQVAHVGGPLRAAYSGAKGGLNSITQSLSVEWAKEGVRVVGVSPTFTNTDMIKEASKNSKFRKNFEKIPLGRPAEPHEIASVVVFLATDAGKFITGETILVDGGFTAI